MDDCWTVCENCSPNLIYVCDSTVILPMFFFLETFKETLFPPYRFVVDVTEKPIYLINVLLHNSLKSKLNLRHNYVDI